MPIPQLSHRVRTTKTWRQINQQKKSKQYLTKKVKKIKNYRPSKKRPGHRFKVNKNKYSPSKLKSLIKPLIGLSILAGIVGILFFLILVAWYARNLPTPDRIIDRSVALSTKIYDRTGETILYDIHGQEQRTIVDLADIPDYVKQATIITEDKNFYEHKGISIWGIIRGVVWQTIRGKRVQGGSTLTQQFIKNAILTPERKISRKIKEWILAYKIEGKYSKDEILQMYFNEIPYGSTAYGIEAASQTYFNKSVSNLSIAEGAILAALPKAPSYYSPYGGHLDKLIGRQHYILSLLANNDYITSEQLEQAKNEKLNFAERHTNILAPHFVMYIKELLTAKYGERMVEQGGLKIYTTLDLDKQKIAEEIIKEKVEQNETNFRAFNASLVAINPNTGEILTMVGSKDYFADPLPEDCLPGKNCLFEPNVNVSLRSRQPGSSFKPIVYTAAFIKGYTPETLLFDVLTTFKTEIQKDYEPHNYGDKEYGPVTIRQAIAGSLNIPAVKTIYLTGIDRVLDLAEEFGYTTLDDRSRFGLSLVLGGGEVKLLEHVSAYGAFAAEGIKNDLVAILKIEDKDGKIIEEFKEPQGKEILDVQIARKINNILSDNEARSFVFGPNSHLILGDRPVAAKTGTTNDAHDAWTIGYTPSLVAGVWTGNNDNSTMTEKAGGSSVAAPIWQEFMSQAVKDTPYEEFIPPEEPQEGEEINKLVLKGELPPEMKVKIDKVSGKLATDKTPPELIEEVTYREIHNILHYIDKDDPQGKIPRNPNKDIQYETWEEAVQKWAKEEGYQTLDQDDIPDEYDDLHTEKNKPKINITSPEVNQTITNRNLLVKTKISAKRDISKVEYYIDNRLMFTDAYYPFRENYIDVLVDNGGHKLKITAYDDVSNQASETVSFNLDTDEPLPAIIWQTPENNTDLMLAHYPFKLTAYVTKLNETKQINFYYILDNQDKEIIKSIDNPSNNLLIIQWTPPGIGSFQLYAEVVKNNNEIEKTEIINVKIE